MTFWIEVFGTTASVIVAISLMMKNIKRLRIINAVGAGLFAIYGLIIQAWPVFGLNLFIFIIDLYYLYQMFRRQDAFNALQVDPHKSEYARLFFDFWRNDIITFNPGFNPEVWGKNSEAIFVLRDMQAVSIVVFERQGNGDYEILLDYAIPNYRDMKNSAFFFQWASKKFTQSLSISNIRFIARSETPAHISYLKSMGFAPSSEQGVFVKNEKITESTRLD